MGSRKNTVAVILLNIVILFVGSALVPILPELIAGTLTGYMLKRFRDTAIVVAGITFVYLMFGLLSIAGAGTTTALILNILFVLIGAIIFIGAAFITSTIYSDSGYSRQDMVDIY